MSNSAHVASDWGQAEDKELELLISGLPDIDIEAGELAIRAHRSESLLGGSQGQYGIPQLHGPVLALVAESPISTSKRRQGQRMCVCVCRFFVQGRTRSSG